MSGQFFECKLNGEGRDVTVSQAITVSVPGMGSAYYNKQHFISDDADGGVYAFDSDESMFAAFVDGVADGTVDQVSRFGGALLSLTGSGFVEPEIYFTCNSGDR